MAMICTLPVLDSCTWRVIRSEKLARRHRQVAMQYLHPSPISDSSRARADTRACLYDAPIFLLLVMLTPRDEEQRGMLSQLIFAGWSSFFPRSCPPWSGEATRIRLARPVPTNEE